MVNSSLTRHSVFPEKESLNEAVNFILDQLPITEPNQLYGLLMMYHNTLLAELNKEA